MVSEMLCMHYIKKDQFGPVHKLVLDFNLNGKDQDRKLANQCRTETVVQS